MIRTCTANRSGRCRCETRCRSGVCRMGARRPGLTRRSGLTSRRVHRTPRDRTPRDRRVLATGNGREGVDRPGRALLRRARVPPARCF